jgi:hydrogenase nickel incorporation protein HypA/HybF
LCRSIYGIVDRARADREVQVVHLQVGQLRQVVPATLEYCWGIITDETPLAGSRLDIDHVPVVLDCSCGARTTVEHALVLTCAACSGGDITLHTGEEFMVTSMDLTIHASTPREN